MLKIHMLLLIAALIVAAGLYSVPPTHMGAGRMQPHHSDAYTLRISSYFQENGITTIVLNNGSVWHLQSPVLWLIGDEVNLFSSDGKWMLHNNSDHSSSKVQFVSIIRQGGHYLRRNENSGGILTLDDGSVWKVNWWERIWGRSWSWQVGDRILISPLRVAFNDRTHLLINIDRSWHHLEASTL